MKGSYKVLLILLLLPFLTGMGGSMLGDGSADKIPQADENFTAIYIDQMGIATKCTGVSIQGETFIEGKKGEGTYTIPFERIDNILFVLKNAELQGRILLKNKNRIELILNKKHKAYGHTKYGTFQIKLINLKKVVLTGKAPKIKGN
jgi:hypothetical protein